MDHQSSLPPIAEELPFQARFPHKDIQYVAKWLRALLEGDGLRPVIEIPDGEDVGNYFISLTSTSDFPRGWTVLADAAVCVLSDSVRHPTTVREPREKVFGGLISILETIPLSDRKGAIAVRQLLAKRLEIPFSNGFDLREGIQRANNFQTLCFVGVEDGKKIVAWS